MTVQRLRLMALAAVLFCAGCWTGDAHLISQSEAENPFGDGAHFSIRFDGQEAFLERYDENNFSLYRPAARSNQPREFELRFKRWRDPLFLPNEKKYIFSLKRNDDDYYYGLITLNEVGHCLYRFEGGNGLLATTIHTIPELKSDIKLVVKMGKEFQSCGTPKAVSREFADRRIDYLVREQSQ